MMSLGERKDAIGVTKESFRNQTVVDSKDLFGARVVESADPDKSRSIDIGLNVYINDYMRAYVDKFYSYMHYDECLHGHEYRFFNEKGCDCPIGSPYIAEHFFEAGHFIKGAQDGVRMTVQRWRALELLNEWNKSAAETAVNGVYKGDKPKPIRWVYFL
jgi:hypothetical protein